MESVKWVKHIYFQSWKAKFILGQTLGGVNAELDFAKETASTLPLRASYS